LEYIIKKEIKTLFNLIISMKFELEVKISCSTTMEERNFLAFSVVKKGFMDG